jgi:hypothetical protein
LPWGLLRDSPKRLRSATLIVATHVKDHEQYQHLKQQLKPLTQAPVIATQVTVLNKESFSPRKVGVFCGIGQPAHFLQTVRDLNQEIVDTLLLKDHESVQPDQMQVFAANCLEKGAEMLVCTEKDYVKLYPTRPETWNLDCAKTPGFNDRKRVNIRNIDPFTIVESRELSRGPTPKFLAEWGISPNLSLCLKIVPIEIQLKIVAGEEHWKNLIENILNLSLPNRPLA